MFLESQDNISLFNSMNYNINNNFDTFSSEKDFNINLEENFFTEKNNIEGVTNILENNNNSSLLKKRGRRKAESSKKKKSHIGIDFDNMQTKIQVHFFNFIINISNDALHTICKNTKLYFKKVDYKLKQKVNDKYFQMLKSLTIKEILEMNISSKYSIFSEEHNKKIIDKIWNSSLWLDKFLNMNYLELFKYYYNKGKPIYKIYFENKDIIFSKNTKSFSDLLEKNISQEKYLKNTAKMAYLNEYDNITNHIFVIIKN